ncbi:MAG: nicotinate (nicotinamide) nucleotide adenylyltransferase [Nanoarchaeota archaeon]|nr:nicotinate (nicotinamide) nucleotide adenylyltransferase [Nanoarchaeota archaeon]
MKIALFGGSFNPIHNLHIKIANEIISRNLVDEVWFIPCGSHPFLKSLINGKDRIKMIKLAIKGNPKFKVLDIEIKDVSVDSKNKSYTSETIKKIKKSFPNDEFYFVIGSDLVGNLAKWNDFSYLSENVEFIVVQRGEFNLYNLQKIKVKSFIEMKETLSSTYVRSKAVLGESIYELVPEPVSKYIKMEGLYQN